MKKLKEKGFVLLPKGRFKIVFEDFTAYGKITVATFKELKRAVKRGDRFTEITCMRTNKK